MQGKEFIQRNSSLHHLKMGRDRMLLGLPFP